MNFKLSRVVQSVCCLIYCISMYGCTFQTEKRGGLRLLHSIEKFHWILDVCFPLACPDSFAGYKLNLNLNAVRLVCVPAGSYLLVSLVPCWIFGSVTKPSTWQGDAIIMCWRYEHFTPEISNFTFHTAFCEVLSYQMFVILGFWVGHSCLIYHFRC